MNLERRIEMLERRRRRHTRLGGELVVPSIDEFCLSDRFLKLRRLYPRQLTLLRLITLQTNDLSSYDHDVIGEWTANFERVSNDEGVWFDGPMGVPPDIFDRVRVCQSEGMTIFPEVTAVIGRRGSKGIIGAICACYRILWMLSTGDPYERFDIQPGKPLQVLVFATTKEQAATNQWMEIIEMLLKAPCFAPFLGRLTNESLSLFSPAQLNAGIAGHKIRNGPDPAAIQIASMPANPVAARGGSSFAVFFDELGHLPEDGYRSAGAIEEAALPTMAQFETDGFVYRSSTPWQQQGPLWDSFRRGRALHADGTPENPHSLAVQLPTDALYLDYERTGPEGDLNARPDRKFPLIKRPQVTQKKLEQERRRDPEGFPIEFGGQFGLVLHPAFPADHIERIFDRELPMKTHGALNAHYLAHGDPAKTRANFGFAVAHAGDFNERGFPVVVFDLLRYWSPKDAAGHELPYPMIEDEIVAYIAGFAPHEVTFDQYEPVFRQRIAQRVAGMQLRSRVSVFELPATESENRRMKNTFRVAAAMDLIRAPYSEQARQELLHLVEKGGRLEPPTTGRIKTNDLAVCMIVLTYRILGHLLAAITGEQLSALPLHASQQGGFHLGETIDPIHRQLSEVGRLRALRARGFPRPRRR